MDADDAAILASELPDKGALSMLSLKSNKLCADGGKVLADGLKGNMVITELDISSNALGENSYDETDMSGIIALADAISDMRAISKLIFNGGVAEHRRWVEGDTVTLESSMTEANFSNKKLGVPGAMIISAWLSSGKDKGAMTSLHVGMNRIPETEMKEIIAMAMRKESIKMLCEVPIKDKTLTELNVSGKNLGMEGALVVVEYLRDNGALSVLFVQSNNLHADGGKALAKGLKGNTGITELDISSNYLGVASNYEPDMSGVIALADAIPDMGAMTKFDISSNEIRAEGGKALAEGLKGNQVITELNFSGNILGYNSNGGTDTSGIVAIADIIPGMGALTKLDISSKYIAAAQGEDLQRICAAGGIELAK